MTLVDVIKHARNREYMSGVERDRIRVKATGEVFTPTELVQEVLNGIDQDLFVDPAKTFLDNCAGDGQFLSEVLIRKMENSSTFEQALSTTYGVDLMQDNVDLCRERLLCGSTDPELIAIVENNIVCADALKYHYRFDGTPCDVVETKEEKVVRIKKEQEAVKKQKERKKSERLAKKEELRFKREQSKSKLTILNPDLFEF